MGRLSTLRRLPAVKLLAVAEVLLLAREHMSKLEPHERRRVIGLLRRGRGRTRNLSAAERAELVRLIAKADPRLFAGLVLQKFSPVPMPERFVRGRRPR